jgi:hypothetical protein
MNWSPSSSRHNDDCDNDDDDCDNDWSESSNRHNDDCDNDDDDCDHNGNEWWQSSNRHNDDCDDDHHDDDDDCDRDHHDNDWWSMDWDNHNSDRDRDCRDRDHDRCDDRHDRDRHDVDWRWMSKHDRDRHDRDRDRDHDCDDNDEDRCDDMEWWWHFDECEDDVDVIEEQVVEAVTTTVGYVPPAPVIVYVPVVQMPSVPPAPIAQVRGDSIVPPRSGDGGVNPGAPAAPVNFEAAAPQDFRSTNLEFAVLAPLALGLFALARRLLAAVR